MLHAIAHANEEDYTDFRNNCLTLPTEPRFALPPLGIPPKEFVKTFFGPNSNLKNAQFRKGTTTLAFVYEPKTENDLGGVVIAVDSRASAGQYISSKSVMKILHIGEKMVATMAGGAADCQFWTRIVAKYCKLFELREKQEISVRAASKYLANVLYGYRNHDLCVYSMVAGVDNCGPHIFSVNSTGARMEQKEISSEGSGSLGAYGFMDTHYKRKMTDSEAVDLGRRAIMHAVYRDSGSGGFCNVTHITPKGKTIYPPADVSDLFYQFAKETNKDLGFEPIDDS